VLCLVERLMHRFLHTFQIVQATDRRQHMSGIGPLGATGRDPRALHATRKVSRSRWAPSCASNHSL
jgi:hypothetical protein